MCVNQDGGGPLVILTVPPVTGEGTVPTGADVRAGEGAMLSLANVHVLQVVKHGLFVISVQ